MPKRKTKPENVKLGLRVKKARQKAGLKQSELAEMIDMSTKNLSLIECGRSGMSIPSLCKLCAVLNISSDSIIFDEAREPKNDTARLMEKLAALGPKQFAVVEAILDQLLLLSRTPPE